MVTALVCQPNPVQQQLWETSLRSQGVTVVCRVADIDWIGEYAKVEQPQLLVLDLSALDTDPYSFCQVLQRQLPGISLLFTQPEMNEDLRSLLIKQGALDVIPYLPPDPYQVISTFIRLFRSLQWFDLFSARQMNEAIESIQDQLKGQLTPVSSAPVDSGSSSSTIPAEPTQSGREPQVTETPKPSPSRPVRYYRGCRVG